MTLEESYFNERLDHLGIVAGVCQEIGLATWLDAQKPGSRQQVSVGIATVAMVVLATLGHPFTTNERNQEHAFSFTVLFPR